MLLLLDTFLVHISSYLRYLAKVSSLAMSFNDFVEQYFTHNDGNQRKGYIVQKEGEEQGGSGELISITLMSSVDAKHARSLADINF